MTVFTTSQVAKICRVSPRTVSKWFDSGSLKGYRIPGSQDRRIPREYLAKFLAGHGMQSFLAEYEKETKTMPSVIQEWVGNLSFMQQTVLLTAVRGPDGVSKEHPAKEVLRWFRRCILISAFDKRVLADPNEKGGGSFTGPATRSINEIKLDYLRSVDALPHHFQLHLLHAIEILGYKHPDVITAKWWREFYLDYVNSLHLNPETVLELDARLGDNERDWRLADQAGVYK